MIYIYIFDYLSNQPNKYTTNHIVIGSTQTSTPPACVCLRHRRALVDDDERENFFLNFFSLATLSRTPHKTIRSRRGGDVINTRTKTGEFILEDGPSSTSTSSRVRRRPDDARLVRQKPRGSVQRLRDKDTEIGSEINERETTSFESGFKNDDEHDDDDDDDDDDGRRRRRRRRNAHRRRKNES